MNASYLEDASGFKGHAEAIHIPRDEQELTGILCEAGSAKIPVTLAGAGTGVTGGRVPLGGWVVSLEKFLKLEITRGYAVAGAGISLKALGEHAVRAGQFYAPDPTEWTASIGGSIANNASGARSFRYGDTRRHVRALRVALMDGSVHSWRRGDAVGFNVLNLPAPRTTKHSAGYRLRSGMDWVDLFIGSEGTLGVVLEAELQLLPLPGDLLTGVVFFESEDAALSAVEAWRPIEELRMLEYLDTSSLRLLRQRYPEIPKTAAACLLIEQEIRGEQDWDAWADRLTDAAAMEAASWFAATAADRERFRAFRHALPEEVNSIVRRRGLLKVGSDYAVPLQQNREMLAFYRSALEREFPEQHVIFGHIGDAHLHVNILPRDAKEFERAQFLMLEFAREAVRLGGTVGAEHGLGKRKAHLLELQYTPEEIAAMRRVKTKLDPDWLLGRGTLFPM